MLIAIMVFVVLFVQSTETFLISSLPPVDIRITRSIPSLLANPRQLDIGSYDQNPSGLMNHELLTAERERQLAREYLLLKHINQQRAVYPTDKDLAAALKIPSVKIQALIKKGEEAKETLVEANMRLVVHIAKYYKSRGVAYPDLIEEGTFGLMKAVDKFDPEKGFRFSTYASWWIKQSVSRAVAEKSRIIRLPVHVHDMMVSVSKIERQFMETYQRKPTIEELAERLALPIPKVEKLLRTSKSVNSMDSEAFNQQKNFSGNKEMKVKDRIASQTKSPSYTSEKNSLRSELRRVMNILTEREAQIVEMRFGLSNGNEMTLEEIGKTFNVTRERIRQIESRALSKMRNPVYADEFREVYEQYLDTASSAIPGSSSKNA